MASVITTLNAQESEVLKEERVVLSGPVNGRRKVSPTLLDKLLFSISNTPSTIPTAALWTQRSYSSHKPFDLPEEIESVAGLEFMGWSRYAATRIFNRWEARPDPKLHLDTLFKYSLSELKRLSIQPLRDLSAIDAMTNLGISTELQNALTDPQFSQIFLSETLYYWLQDTMRNRRSTLSILLQRLKNRAIQTLAKRQLSTKLVGAVLPSAASSTEQPPTTTPLPDPTPDAEHSIAQSPIIITQQDPPSLADHYTLYKGRAQITEEDGVFDIGDGQYNLDALQRYRGGDFNQREAAWYFTKEKETAEKYRQWAERRDPFADTWLIQIQVPASFINSLRTEELWFSADWKEFVWNCRNKTPIQDTSPKFDKLHQADFIHGHICGGPNPQITRIKKGDIQWKITEDSVLRNKERKATQSVFMKQAVVDLLSKEVQGKIHIHVFPAKGLLDFWDEKSNTDV